MCAWAVNIVSFYRVFCDVEPKRLALESSNKQLADAQDKLKKIQDKIYNLEEALGKLTAQFEKVNNSIIFLSLYHHNSLKLCSL